MQLLSNTNTFNETIRAVLFMTGPMEERGGWGAYFDYFFRYSGKHATVY